MADDDPYNLLADLIRSAVERDPTLAPLGEAMGLVHQARCQPHPYTLTLLDSVARAATVRSFKGPCRYEWSGDRSRKDGGIAFTLLDADNKRVFEMTGVFAVVPTVEHCIIALLLERLDMQRRRHASEI